jgi:predicted helicase
MDEQSIIRVGVRLRSELAVAAVSWPASPDSFAPSVLPPKRPRPHQQEAIEAITTGFEKSSRGQLIMACGTGKTLVGFWTAERIGWHRLCVVLPSLSLLSQTLREWTANAATPFSYLAVCSDQTVAEDRDHNSQRL